MNRSSDPWTHFSSLLAALALAAVAFNLYAGEAEDLPPTPQEKAFDERITKVFESLLTSPDLALRVLYSFDGLEQRADGTMGIHETIPIETLVDQARGSTDPLALDALLWRCNARCDKVSLAMRWTVADTQNQVAWLALASAQRAGGDAAAARASFLRASLASTWHGHHNEAVRRAIAVLPRKLAPDEYVATANRVRRKAVLLTPYSEASEVGFFCADAETVRDACWRILETMVRDSDDLFAVVVAPGLAARSGVARSTVLDYQRKSDALLWAVRRRFEASPVDGGTGPEAIDELNMLLQLGERAALERWLSDQHVGEADAAARYVATLSAEQLAHRDEARGNGTPSRVNAGSTRSTAASP